jgi:hypothetical protein
MSLTLPPIEEPGLKGALARLGRSGTGRVVLAGALAAFTAFGVALWRSADLGLTDPSGTRPEAAAAPSAPGPSSAQSGAGDGRRASPGTAASGATDEDHGREGTRRSSPVAEQTGQDAEPGAGGTPSQSATGGGASGGASGGTAAAKSGSQAGSNATSGSGTSGSGTTGSGTSGTDSATPRSQTSPAVDSRQP